MERMSSKEIPSCQEEKQKVIENKINKLKRKNEHLKNIAFTLQMHFQDINKFIQIHTNDKEEHSEQPEKMTLIRNNFIQKKIELLDHKHPTPLTDLQVDWLQSLTNIASNPQKGPHKRAELVRVNSIHDPQKRGRTVSNAPPVSQTPPVTGRKPNLDNSEHTFSLKYFGKKKLEETSPFEDSLNSSSPLTRSLNIPQGHSPRLLSEDEEKSLHLIQETRTKVGSLAENLLFERSMCEAVQKRAAKERDESDKEKKERKRVQEEVKKLNESLKQKTQTAKKNKIIAQFLAFLLCFTWLVAFLVYFDI